MVGELLKPEAPLPHRFAIALGASLGDGVAMLRLAYAAIDAQPELRLTGSSAILATPPEGGVARGSFVNAVIAGVTGLEAGALLVRLKALERRLGRGIARRWADRELDLDLLLHDGLVGDQSTPAGALSLPHPRMRERAFVLVPLAQAWPDAQDPRDGARFADLPAARTPLPVRGVLPRPLGAIRRRAG